MSPPIARPIPRFVADSSQEGAPYGDLESRLQEQFLAACRAHAGEAGSGAAAETVRWFPERGWGGRVYLPATARAAESGPEGVSIEFFGHVSFVRSPDGEPGDLRATAEFTDVTAEENPDWRIDLNDDVIGAWSAEGDRGGEITLIWGMPMVRGAIAATAELGGEVLDQAPVTEGRFTLLAVDAVVGFDDPLYLEVRLWDRRIKQLASEGLYEDGEEDEEEGAEDEANGSEDEANGSEDEANGSEDEANGSEDEANGSEDEEESAEREGKRS